MKGAKVTLRAPPRKLPQRLAEGKVEVTSKTRSLRSSASPPNLKLAATSFLERGTVGSDAATEARRDNAAGGGGET